MGLNAEKDERSRRGIFARFGEVFASIISLRLVVAIAASSTVTGAVAGPLAIKAFEARARSENASESTTTLGIVDQGVVVAGTNPQPNPKTTPTAAPSSPSSPPASTSSTTTTQPNSTTSSTQAPGPQVTLPGGVTTTTSSPATSPPSSVGSTTTTQPATTQPPTTSSTTTTQPATTTTLPAFDGLMVAVDSNPDAWAKLQGSSVYLGTRVVFRGPPGTTSVSFWLDGARPAAPTSTDTSAPFDLYNGADGSNFFDSSKLTEGAHTVTYIAAVNGIEITETEEFIVFNGAKIAGG